MSVAAPPPQRRPLGRLMVEAGLLSEEQLELALQAQAGSDRHLGQVVVDLGFAAAPAVANALAIQEGRAFKSEYGYALGSTDSIGSDAPPPLSPGAPPARRSDPPAPAGEPDLAEQLAALDRRAEELVGAVRRIAELESERDSIRAELDGLRSELERALRERDEARARSEELEAAVPPAPAVAGEHTLLFPAGDGYRVVRRQGPPPSVGERVAVGLPDAEPVALTVTRVAAAPGSPPCAYLAA